MSLIARAAILVALGAPSLSAQTTIVLRQASTQVTDTTIRGGSYANTNYNHSVLVTRASNYPVYTRRAFVKFDTQNTIPAGSYVSSAKLTVTVKAGGADASRRIGAYYVAHAFTDSQATWNVRRTSTAWTSAGGDLGSKYAEAIASNVSGSTVSFDVTSLVRAAVDGKLGSSRYTRVALVDLDGATRYSYREYYPSEDTTASHRPTLSVTYGGSAGSTTPPPSTSGTTLRVLQWNTHHGGYRTDGVWDPNLLMSWVAKINPDIVSLNEVEYYTSWGNSDDPAMFQKMLEQKTGRTWYKLFAQNSGNWSAHGNGDLILSKYPFSGTSRYALPYTRAVAEVQIAVNGRTVNFASTHLDASSTSYRLTEISHLLSWFGTMAQQRIVAGDFNAWPGSTENAKMTAYYYDSWAVAKAAGTAISAPTNPDGDTRHARIDYVYYSHGATDLVLKSCQVFETADANGVKPSDHRPVLSVFTVK